MAEKKLKNLLPEITAGITPGVSRVATPAPGTHPEEPQGSEPGARIVQVIRNPGPLDQELSESFLEPTLDPAQDLDYDPDLVDEHGRPLPKYLRLARKDVRMYEGQMEELTKLSRLLNKRRRGSGERLTENTLIRLAIDLLLANKDHLRGITEEELRAKLGLPDRE